MKCLRAVRGPCNHPIKILLRHLGSWRRYVLAPTCEVPCAFTNSSNSCIPWQRTAVLAFQGQLRAFGVTVVLQRIRFSCHHCGLISANRYRRKVNFAVQQQMSYPSSLPYHHNQHVYDCHLHPFTGDWRLSLACCTHNVRIYDQFERELAFAAFARAGASLDWWSWQTSAAATISLSPGHRRLRGLREVSQMPL